MRDKRLQQTPIMIMPKSRQDIIGGSYPTRIQDSSLTAARAAQLENLAVFYERDLYSRPRAAGALKELARDEQSPTVSPGIMVRQNITVAVLHTQAICNILVQQNHRVVSADPSLFESFTGPVRCSSVCRKS